MLECYLGKEQMRNALVRMSLALVGRVVHSQDVQVYRISAGLALNCLVHPLLQSVAHRPWPLPSGAWVMKQNWHDLLFAHWPLPPEALRPLVPRN